MGKSRVMGKTLFAQERVSCERFSRETALTSIPLSCMPAPCGAKVVGLLQVIAILLSAVHELEKVDEMVGLREFEVAVPPTPVTTRCTPTTEGIRADAGLDCAYSAHAHFSLWATFNCPGVTIALPSAPLSVTSNGQKMTLMGNADGSFSQLWEIGAPSGVTSDRGDESHRRVLSIGQSSAANAELGLVDELRGATVDELQRRIRCRLEGSEGKSCVIRVSGGSPRECDVAIQGIGPIVFWIDWPLLYDVCKLATRLSLIITLVNNLTAEWYRLVGYLDTAAICSCAGIESWTRWSASLACTKCSIWVPLEDHSGSSPLEWKSWGDGTPPIVVADFHLAYSAVWSSGEPQPLGWYKDVIITVTLSQSTISLGTSKCTSTESWGLRGSTSHKIVEPFHARLLFKSKEKGRTLKTNGEVDPVKIVLSTSDIVIISAIAEICVSLYSCVDADCHKLSLDIGLSAAQEQPNGVEGEAQPSSYPPSESSDVVTSPREALSTRFAFKVATLQVEIVDAGTATVFRGSRPKATVKFAMVTIEDINVTASSEVDITFTSDLSSAALQEWLLDLSLEVDVFNRPLSGYEPCVEPVQLRMVLGSDKGGLSDDLWRLTLNSTWVNILITECCLESALAFYHSLVNRLQEFSSTIDETYHREWVLDSAQNTSPKRAASPRPERRSVKVTFAAPVHESPASRMPGQERAYHRAHEFSAGKVLVDRFTSTAALWMGDALPVSPTAASEAEPLVSALEPSVGYETPFSIDWSSASIWQKMMLYKEQNLVVTTRTESDDPAVAREATTSNAQLQAESKFDFVRSTAGSEVGPGRDFSCTRRVLPSQQTNPSLWRVMQEDGYSHGLPGLPGPLSRGRHLSVPSLPSPPPSPDSFASPDLASAQPRPTLVDIKRSLSSLDVGMAGRRGPKLTNLTGLPILVRTTRDAPERGVTMTGKPIDDWLKVVNGCRDGFALPLNESDGSTLPFDLCVQLGCRKVFVERLGSLNQSSSRVHSFRVPVEAFRATNVLRSTPKGVNRDSSPTRGSVENESGILNRARREWTTVRIMVRVELHPTLSVWDVCISSLYTVVNDTSATLVIVGPWREPWANSGGGDVPSGGSFMQTRGAGNHPRGLQSSTRAELVRSTYVPPHLILAPGQAVPIPIDWMLPEQCFRPKPRAIGEKKFTAIGLGLWEVCQPVIQGSRWDDTDSEGSWRRLEQCLSPLLPRATLEGLARYQSTQIKDYSQMPGSSFEFDVPIDGTAQKLSLISTVIAVSSQARKTRTSDLSFEILLEWALQIRNRLCRSVSLRLIPPGVDLDGSAGWVCHDLQPGENAKCPRLMQQILVQAGDFVSDPVDVSFSKARLGDSVLRLKPQRAKGTAPLYIRIEVASALDPSEALPLSLDGRIRLQSFARFVTLYSAYWVLNRLEFPIYLWRVGFGDGLVANRSQVGRFWTHSRSDVSTNRDPRKTLRVRAACLPAVQSSDELSEPFRVDVRPLAGDILAMVITLRPPPQGRLSYRGATDSRHIG